MKRERYEARSLGWQVIRIDPDGTESTVEVWPEEKAKHRAKVLDQRVAESFEARKGRDECPPNALGTPTSSPNRLSISASGHADNEYAMIDSTIVRAHSAQRRRSKKTAKTRLGCALRHKPKPEPKRDYRGER